MKDPKEVMMELEAEMVAEFDEKHGREPNPREMAKISETAYNGIGEYYADIGDRARMIAKERTLWVK